MRIWSGHPRRTFVLLDLVAPGLIRLAQMLGQLGLVAWLDGGSGNSLWSRFSVWDGQLYAAIVQHGYPHAIVIGSDGSLVQGQQFAFSPVFPGAAWLLHTVLRLGVLPSQLVVSWAASLAFGVLVHLIVRGTGHSRRAGYVATWLIGALPMAVVLQMGYAEALCAALEAAAVYAAVRRRWWVAAALSLLAGATRPTGGLVGLAVGCLALLDRRRTPTGSRRASPLQVAATTVSGILGMVAWLYFVWIRTGHPTGWFQVEKAGWGTHFDMGRQGFAFLHDTLRKPDVPGWTAVVATLIVLLTMTAVLTVVLGGLETLPYSLIGVLTLAITLGSTNYWHSRPRLLLGAALLVVPLGTMIGRARLRAVAPVLLFAFLASAWFGAWMVDGWPYAI